MRKVTRTDWYKNLSVQYEIIKSLMRRETFFLKYYKDEEQKWKSTPPVRWLLSNYIGILEKHWEQFRFLEQDMNLYNSVATYKDFPLFSYKWYFKSREQKAWLKKFHEHIAKYELFIETDSDDLTLSVGDAIKIRNFLNKYKVKSSLTFSGKKGIHTIVPYEEFEFLGFEPFNLNKVQTVADRKTLFSLFPDTPENLRKKIDLIGLFRILTIRISNILGCDTVDESVWDIKRVRKTPYSWDVKSGNIALPLTDTQLDNFNVSIVKPETVLWKGVFKRGFFYRNENVDKKDREKGILQMFKDLEIFK